MLLQYSIIVLLGSNVLGIFDLCLFTLCVCIVFLISNVNIRMQFYAINYG